MSSVLSLLSYTHLDRACVARQKGGLRRHVYQASDGAAENVSFRFLEDCADLHHSEPVADNDRLAIGSPLSRFDLLSSKVTSINSKHGPFDACVVIGDLFKEGSDGSELDGVTCKSLITCKPG